MKRKAIISRSVESDKEFWSNLYNISNWKVIQSNLTYEQAQNLELHHANMGYERGSIPVYKDGQVWSVCSFEYP